MEKGHANGTISLLVLLPIEISGVLLMGPESGYGVADWDVERVIIYDWQPGQDGLAWHP